MSQTLLDTSVLIATGGELRLEPGQTAAISVITLGELRAGVTLAINAQTRAVRQARLAAVRGAFNPLLVDEAVAERYGEVLAVARSQKRATKATDLLILATAAATGRVLLTLDHAQTQLARAVEIPVVEGVAPKA